MPGIKMQVKPPVASTIVCMLLIVLFVYTGTSKWLNMRNFLVDLNNQPFADSLTPLIAIVLPFSEITTAFLLLFDRTRLAGLIFSMTLMSVFTIYTILILSNVFAEVPCACGGLIKQLTWEQHLVFNVFFLFAIVIAFKKERRQ